MASKTSRKRRRKDHLFVVQKERCFYCGTAVDRKRFTLDHVVPRVRGGGSSLSNLVGCCSDCNEWKSDKLVDPEWVEKRRAEL